MCWKDTESWTYFTLKIQGCLTDKRQHHTFMVQLMISEHLDCNTVSLTELPLGNSCTVIPVLQVGKWSPNVLPLKSAGEPVAL